MWELIPAIVAVIGLGAIAIKEVREKERCEEKLRSARAELSKALIDRNEAVRGLWELKGANTVEDPDAVPDYHTDLRMEYDTWKLWSEEPQTIEFMRCIKAGRSLREQYSGQGKTLDNANSNNTQAWTAHSVGYCRAITDILEKIRPMPKPGSKS